jgi:antirestriction protein
MITGSVVLILVRHSKATNKTITQKVETKMTTEINVYVANLGKYNEGILQGEWFTLPTELDEIKEAIGINAEYEEWAIHDYEAPFQISEYESITKLNELAEMLEGMDEDEANAVCALVDNGCITDYAEAIEAVQNGMVCFYHDCKDMEDVAYSIYEESGQLAELEKHISVNYIDFESIGRDMDIEGTFYELEGNVFMQYLK